MRRRSRHILMGGADERRLRPVFVVTGPSGAGKGTLIERVLPRFPELAVAVSATTRPQRPGEQDGVHYYFLTRDEFDRRIEAREFLEWVDYVGNRYGTLLSEIERLRAAGKAPLLELETEGALRVKRRVEGAVTVFVTAPVEELARRLRERATESTGEIGGRIETAKRQLSEQGEFDYVVENDDRDRAADRLAAVIERELATATIAPT
jgi:guanylate kinase